MKTKVNEVLKIDTNARKRAVKDEEKGERGFLDQKSSASESLKLNERLGVGKKDHWEIHLPPTHNGYDDEPAGAFLPRGGKFRAQPHQKVNECDH